MSEHPSRSVSTANASANPDCLDNRKCIPLRPCRRRAYDCWTFMQPNIERAKRLQVSSVAISSARDPWQHATLLLRSERSDFFAMLCLCCLPRTGSIGARLAAITAALFQFGSVPRPPSDKEHLLLAAVGPAVYGFDLRSEKVILQATMPVPWFEVACKVAGRFPLGHGPPKLLHAASSSFVGCQGCEPVPETRSLCIAGCRQGHTHSRRMTSIR